MCSGGVLFHGVRLYLREVRRADIFRKNRASMGNALLAKEVFARNPLFRFADGGMTKKTKGLLVRPADGASTQPKARRQWFSARVFLRALV